MKKEFQKLLHRLFIPSRHNNHHPISISHKALTAYLVLAIMSFVILRNISLQTGNVLGFATDISVDRLLALTNDERQQNNLTPLVYNPQLSQAAIAKAQDMFAKDYWSHFGPNGETPWNFILTSGYQYEYAGENLAKNYIDSKAVVNAWLNSETHKANILNRHYEDVGYAVVNGTIANEQTTLVVQMFGSKTKIADPQVAVINSNNLLPTVTPSNYQNNSKSQVASNNDHNQINVLEANDVEVMKQSTNQAKAISPSFNLLPAFRIIAVVAILFLILVFIIDLFHLSKTQYHRHRGKHLAHIIFLVTILIGIYFLGLGSIL